MSPTDFFHRRLTFLLLATLIAGPIGCDRAVTRFELESTQSRVDATRTRLAALDQQVLDLQNELKALKSFGGPEHQKKIEAAVALRAEKTELETLKKDLDSRLEHFEKEAARHREELAKMKQP